MNAYDLIMAIVILIVFGSAIFLHRRKKVKDSLVELKCRFYTSENTDLLLEKYKTGTSINVDGILGNDFMVANGYIINYEDMVVGHKSVKISIKETMDIIELPLIPLYQNNNTYVFLLDTGATDSLINSKSLETMKYKTVESDIVEFQGYGGSSESTGAVETSLYYARKRIQ